VLSYRFLEFDKTFYKFKKLAPISRVVGGRARDKPEAF
jgi:hypothetical protein